MLLVFSHYVWLLGTAGTAAHQPPLSSTISQSFLRFMSIESVMPSNHLILCHPLLFLPSVFPSIRVFCDEFHIRWSKCWHFSFSNSPSNECPGFISLSIVWFDLLYADKTATSSCRLTAPQVSSVSEMSPSILQHSHISFRQEPDWSCLGHMPTTEPISVARGLDPLMIGQPVSYADLCGRGRAVIDNPTMPTWPWRSSPEEPNKGPWEGMLGI